MNPFTALQSLYWQKVELHDAAWRIERRIDSLMRRGRKAKKLFAHHASVIGEIAAIEGQMAVLEGAA